MHFFNVSIACYSTALMSGKGSLNTMSYVVRNIIVKMFINRVFPSKVRDLSKWTHCQLLLAVDALHAFRHSILVQFFFFFLFFFSLSFHCCLFWEHCRNLNISPLFGEIFDFINESLFCWIYFWKIYTLPYYFELK